MRKSLALALSVFLIVGLIGCAAQGPAGTATKSDLRVGAASAPVNPANGTFLAGYDHNRRSTGVHDDLYAKAVLFDDGRTPVALVVIDSIGVQYDTVEAIRQAVGSRIKGITLPPDQILVSSTHTHGSPDVIGIYGPDESHTGRDPVYMKLLVDTAAEQVVRAATALKPAQLFYAGTECKGWAVNDSEPGDVDNSVTILQCVDTEGRSIATLTHFACHPTVLDGDNTLASADWVGAFYKAMAAGLPGEHLFLQGGVGGWIQPETPERTFTLAEQYGKDLAGKTLAAVKDAKPLHDTGIRFGSKVFQMPNENPLFAQIGPSGTNLVPRDLSNGIRTEVAWFAVGDAQFATHPGESAPVFTRETRKLMKTGPKFVLGLGLDQLGYILKPEYFDNPKGIPHAEYLTGMSPGRQAGPSMMAALASIVP